MPQSKTRNNPDTVSKKTKDETALVKKIRVIDPDGKRKAILNAAAKHFANHGFAGANTGEIAKDAGVSVGTVFRIFSTKADLANAEFQSVCTEQIKTNIRSGITNPEKNDPRQSFQNLIHEQTQVVTTNPYEYIFFEANFRATFLDKESLRLQKEIYGQWVAWVSHFQKKGVFVDADITAVMSIIVGALSRFARDSALGRLTLTPKLLADFEKLVWNALTTQKGRGR